MWNTYFSDDTKQLLESLYARYDEESKNTQLFPPRENLLKALQATQPENVRVVILGQDPYIHFGQAMGLAFSVKNSIAPPPSLQNIILRLEDYLQEPINHHDLTPWTKQGVLLLNTVLCVKQGHSNSCATWGWQDFTKEILKITLELPQTIVYLLWGFPARDTFNKARIECNVAPRKFQLLATHPSPLSANNIRSHVPAFNQSQPFGSVNALFKQLGEPEIDWRI